MASSDTVSIQWKGTDACFDLTCPTCEAYTHYCVEMPFCGALECPSCRTVWIIPWRLPIRLVGDDPGDQWRVEAARRGSGVTVDYEAER